MDVLKLDINSHIPHIVEAYIEVFGEEYKDIIKEKVKRIYYVIYNNKEGVNRYAYFLEQSKRIELYKTFFKDIGVDISKYEKQNYANGMDKEFLELVETYRNGLNAFDTDIDMTQIDLDEPHDVKIEYKLDNQIDFLNYLKSPDTEEITVDNYIKYYQSEEYKNIKEKIDVYLEKYKQINEEYQECLAETARYRKYVEAEEQREEKIEKAKQYELYQEIREYLPKEVLKILDAKYVADTKKSEEIFNGGLYSKSYIEYFSEQCEEKLNDPNVPEEEKERILYFRMRYFKKLGLNVEIDALLKVDYYKYKECIEKEEIKKLIPTTEVVDKIQKSREQKYEECRKKYICTKVEYIQAAANYGNKEYLYKQIEKPTVGTTMGKNAFGLDTPILFFTVRQTEEGSLDFVLLHELCHIIEYSSMFGENAVYCGFDNITDNEANPYNSNKRKYERLNETITDVFAMEARKVLQDKGIYMLEDKEHTRWNVENQNTHSILKLIVKPLLSRYRKQVVSARMWGDRKYLFDEIGEENFEELNDVINKMDYLISQGLIQKINDEQRDDKLIKEYNEQVSRIEKIYTNMEKHYSENNIEYDER